MQSCLRNKVMLTSFFADFSFFTSTVAVVSACRKDTGEND